MVANFESSDETRVDEARVRSKCETRVRNKGQSGMALT